jgi:ribosome-binding factor A
MESVRQNKVSRLLQKDLSEIFLLSSRTMFQGAFITVTKVSITKDISVARIYLSIFEPQGKTDILPKIKAHSFEIKKLLVERIHNQIKNIPTLEFFIDDSLDYIENIDNLLKK